MTKLLNKSKKILSDASSMDIKLDFTFDIDNSKPTSYKDIAYNKYEYEKNNLICRIDTLCLLHVRTKRRLCKVG